MTPIFPSIMTSQMNRHVTIAVSANCGGSFTGFVGVCAISTVRWSHGRGLPRRTGGFYGHQAAMFFEAQEADWPMKMRGLQPVGVLRCNLRHLLVEKIRQAAPI